MQRANAKETANSASLLCQKSCCGKKFGAVGYCAYPGYGSPSPGYRPRPRGGGRLLRRRPGSGAALQPFCLNQQAITPAVVLAPALHTGLLLFNPIRGWQYQNHFIFPALFDRTKDFNFKSYFLFHQLFSQNPKSQISNLKS